MPHADRSRIHERPDRGRQVEEADQVGDSGARAAHGIRHLLMGERKLADEAAQRSSLLRRGELLALDVLDERDRDRLLIRQLANHPRNLAEPRELSRLPAALARDDLELMGKTGNRPDHDRLNDPVRLDRGGQFRERLLAQLAARLKRAAADRADRYGTRAGPVALTRVST